MWSEHLREMTVKFMMSDARLKGVSERDLGFFRV
jgi:hypothetical protein